MYSTGTSKKTHSFFAFLSLSYLAVYAVCALLLYLINARIISESTRAFDRDDIRSDSLEYAEILRDNASGNWLAEEIALENLPSSTLFSIRLLGPDGNVVYAASQPAILRFPAVGKREKRRHVTSSLKTVGVNSICPPISGTCN